MWVIYISNGDSIRNRFVFAAIDFNPGNVWYGYSNDSQGSSWTFKSIPLMFGSSTVSWDYPSIGVDATGRVIVGAVKFQNNQDAGFWTVLSSDGINFTLSPARVGNSPGAFSRVVATNDRFEAFIPTLVNGLPRDLLRYESLNGTSWPAFPTQTLLFGALQPSNESPGTYSPNCPDPNRPCISGCTPPCGEIFYAPILGAKGYTNGLWSVVIPVGVFSLGFFNNVYICTSSRGCGLVNQQGNDQFLGGVSVSGDGGYWVFYYTFSSVFFGERRLPLITQAIYFPPGQSAIGRTINTDIDAKKWAFVARCTGGVGCFGAGDYQQISSNPFAASSTPFMRTTTNPLSRPHDVYQNFLQDPEGQDVASFEPNFIPFPVGADLSSLAPDQPPEPPGTPRRIRRSTLSHLARLRRGERTPAGVARGLEYPPPLAPNGRPWGADTVQASIQGLSVPPDHFEPNFVPIPPGVNVAEYLGQPPGPRTDSDFRPGLPPRPGPVELVDRSKPRR